MRDLGTSPTGRITRVLIYQLV